MTERGWKRERHCERKTKRKACVWDREHAHKRTSGYAGKGERGREKQAKRERGRERPRERQSERERERANESKRKRERKPLACVSCDG